MSPTAIMPTTKSEKKILIYLLHIFKVILSFSVKFIAYIFIFYILVSSGIFLAAVFQRHDQDIIGLLPNPDLITPLLLRAGAKPVRNM